MHDDGTNAVLEQKVRCSDLIRAQQCRLDGLILEQSPDLDTIRQTRDLGEVIHEDLALVGLDLLGSVLGQGSASIFESASMTRASKPPPCATTTPFLVYAVFEMTRSGLSEVRPRNIAKTSRSGASDLQRSGPL